MRRRFMSAKEKRTYSNIFNVTIRCTMDEYDENGGPRIFNDAFELSQVLFIRVALGDGEYKELDISHVVELPPGDYDIEIGLGYFYNASYMFLDVNLLFCDMSDVDLSLLTIATSMFRNTFIENTPFEKLPATTLAKNCYAAMFEGCTLLATAPELPATNLADYCYQGMFEGCTSLAAAPVLPATTLAKNCYAFMFDGCTNLNYIKMLATDISAPYCLFNWVKDVSSTGTFVKSKDATWDVVGDSGVPTGWTVITDDEEGGVKLISFTIYLTQYQAEEGMTWGEWVNSKYNTGGYYIDFDDSISDQSGSAWIGTSEYYVFSQDIIIEGYVYALVA